MAAGRRNSQNVSVKHLAVFTPWIQIFKLSGNSLFESIKSERALLELFPMPWTGTGVGLWTSAIPKQEITPIS